MKITYITHACLLIEINNIKILTDPWLTGPSWGGLLWHNPVHNYNPSNLPKPDIIYFSHGHEDHFHHETITNFPKKWFDAIVLAPNFNVSWWEDEIKKKFKNYLFLSHNETFCYNKNLELQMFLNNSGQFDSSIKVKNNKRCIFLQTDNLMDEQEARRISKIDNIDVAFVIPFLTGVFPGFYDWNSDVLKKLSEQKIEKSLNYCAKIVRALKPKYAIPYACDVGYLGNNFYMNLVHRNDKTKIVNKLKKKKIKTKPIILNSGDWINLFKKKVNIKNENTNNDDYYQSLIKFSNTNLDEYKRYQVKENLPTQPNFKNLIRIFINNLKRNIKNLKKFNFETLIIIEDLDKDGQILINFKNKIIKNIKNNNDNLKPDLKITIESKKIRNLLLRKYPMNFLTFHNGGYRCKRKVLNLTNNEKKFLSWINSLDFFI